MITTGRMLVLGAALLAGMALRGQGHRIVVACAPLARHPITLGHPWGGELRADVQGTVGADGRFVIEGARPLPQGLYRLGFPQDGLFLDLLLDSVQHFSVDLRVDEAGQVQAAFTGSPANDQWQAYQHFTRLVDGDYAHLNDQLTGGAFPEANVVSNVLAQNRELKLRLYRRRRIAADPDGLVGALFGLLMEPEPETVMDSLSTQRYMRAHYWDDVHLWDGRLTYTPWLMGRLERYWTRYMAPAPDSVIACVDRVMGQAIADERMTELVLGRLLHATRTHEYPWPDRVFMHLYERYVSGRSHAWLTGDEAHAVNEHALFLMAHSTRGQAPPLTLHAPDGSTAALADVRAAYTVLVFWDPACHHCTETLPRIDSLYRADWKAKGVRIYAVAVQSALGPEAWRSYITDHRLTDWTHGYHVRVDATHPLPAGETDAAKDYDVWYFPSMFLLDKDKRFMGTKLSFEQLQALVERVLAQ